MQIKKKIYFGKIAEAKIDALVEYLGLTTKTVSVFDECEETYCTGHSESFLILEPKKKQSEKDYSAEEKK